MNYHWSISLFSVNFSVFFRALYRVKLRYAPLQLACPEHFPCYFSDPGIALTWGGCWDNQRGVLRYLKEGVAIFKGVFKYPYPFSNLIANKIFYRVQHLCQLIIRHLNRWFSSIFLYTMRRSESAQLFALS